MKKLTERFKSSSLTQVLSTYPYQIINGQLIPISDTKDNYVKNGYMINDIVYSVINLILDKVRLPEWNTYKVVDDNALKGYLGFQRKSTFFDADYTKMLNLRKKALEPIQAPGKLGDLLRWPNEYQTFNNMVADSVGFKLLTGDSFIWSSILDGGANQGKPQEMHNLPSQYMIIIASGGFPPRELGYRMPQIFNIDFAKASVMHHKYWNPNWDINGGQLYGMSPLKAALSNLNRSNSAKTAATSMFQNMGIKGVLYVDDPNFDAANRGQEAAALKRILSTEYSGEESAGKIASSGYKIGWQALGLSPVDLAIIESENWDMRMICNIYGVPSQLMNDPKNRTYNNQKEGEKALTSRCALPQLVEFRNHFNRKLQSDWGFKGQNVYVDFDPTVFTELQKDLTDIATWTSQLLAITPNEQRDLLGLDALPGPEFDEPYILTGTRTPASDMTPNQTDQAIQDEQLAAGD